jgi:hypothetical protein
MLLEPMGRTSSVRHSFSFQESHCFREDQDMDPDIFSGTSNIKPHGDLRLPEILTKFSVAHIHGVHIVIAKQREKDVLILQLGTYL